MRAATYPAVVDIVAGWGGQIACRNRRCGGDAPSAGSGSAVGSEGIRRIDCQWQGKMHMETNKGQKKTRHKEK